MRTIISLIAFLTTTNYFAQKDICGDYIVPEFKGTDIYKKLTLNPDSSFEFLYIHNGNDKNSGKWHLNIDTLILFAYKDSEPKIDTVSGTELVVNNQDSIEIIFIDKYNKRPSSAEFVVNRLCTSDHMRLGGINYKIPKQDINYIYIPHSYQIYIIKSKKANKIIIELNPLKIFFRTRVVEYRKSLVKSNLIIPIMCDGQPSKWGNLTKQ